MEQCEHRDFSHGVDPRLLPCRTGSSSHRKTRTTNPIPPIESHADLVDDIVAYETGLLADEDAEIGLFQRLIDSGLAWQLQGHYGRVADILIERGACTPPATEVDERPVRPELIGTRCECGAPYDTDRRGYSCAF